MRKSLTLAVTLLVLAATDTRAEVVSMSIAITDTNRFFQNIYAAGLLVAKPTPGGVKNRSVNRREHILDAGFTALKDHAGVSFLRYTAGNVEIRGPAQNVQNAVVVLRNLENTAFPVWIRAGFVTNAPLPNTVDPNNVRVHSRETTIRDVAWLPVKSVHNGEAACVSPAGLRQCGFESQKVEVEASLIPIRSVQGVTSLFATLYCRNQPAVLSASAVIRTNEQAVLTIEYPVTTGVANVSFIVSMEPQDAGGKEGRP